MQPAEDFFTGSVVGPFIDTVTSIDLHRFTLAQVKSGMRVYVSRATVKEWAEQLGLFEKPGETEDYQDGYKEGYQDALKENIGDSIRDFSDKLGLIADWLGAMASVETDEESAGVHAEATAIDERAASI
jgi:hypothetical protein